jgi:uncharacterized membrane protein YbjE (DUF340 family)
MDQQVALCMIGLTVSLIAGISLGYSLRKRRRLNLNRVSFAVIIVLIFSLGFSIGSNGELLSSLPKVGLNAVVIALFAMAFSVVFVKLVRRVAGLK